MNTPAKGIAPPPSQQPPREIELRPHESVIDGRCKIETLAGTVTVATAPPNPSVRPSPVSPDEDGFYLLPAIKITAGANGARIRIEYVPPVEKRY